MVQLTNIHSLSDFQRNTKEHLKRLKRSGDPEVLTVNGKAELVVQDARSYQKLLNQAAEAEAVEILKRRLKAVARGVKSRPLAKVLDDLGRKYESPRKRA
jgi:PHD/YefM family antitoxin component YafN of YafNO toxin-antitoxin module